MSVSDVSADPAPTLGWGRRPAALAAEATGARARCLYAVRGIVGELSLREAARSRPDGVAAGGRRRAEDRTLAPSCGGARMAAVAREAREQRLLVLGAGPEQLGLLEAA